MKKGSSLKYRVATNPKSHRSYENRHKTCEWCGCEYCDVTTRNLSHTCSWECQNAQMVSKRRERGNYIRTPEAIAKSVATLKDGFETGRLLHPKKGRHQHWHGPWTDEQKANHWTKTPEGREKLSKQSKGRKLSEKECYRLSVLHSSRVRSARETNHTSGNGGKREDLNMMYFRSNWEANLARILNYERKTWEYEPRTFRLAYNLTYTPDFYVHEDDIWYELKGRMTERSKKQLELMPKLFPEIKIILVEGKQYDVFRVKYKKLIAWEGN